MDAESVQKIYNLAIKNAILIKITTIMGVHETRHFLTRQGVIEKPLKTSQKIVFLA